MFEVDECYSELAVKLANILQDIHKKQFNYHRRTRSYHEAFRS